MSGALPLARKIEIRTLMYRGMVTLVLLLTACAQTSDRATVPPVGEEVSSRPATTVSNANSVPTTVEVAIAIDTAPPSTQVAPVMPPAPAETTPQIIKTQTTSAPTGPPTTVAVEITPLSEAEAMFTWNSYLAETTSGDYQAAWSNLTPRYQEKYLGYDNFVRFWNTVDGAGVYSFSSRSIPNGITLELHAWYGRRADGTTSNEHVDVDVFKDAITGQIVIDDYRYLGRD